MSDLTPEIVKQALDGFSNMDGLLPDDIQIATPLASVIDAARLWAEGTPIQWCEEHESGVNWHTGLDIMEKVERCDAYRLRTYPGQTTDHIPDCRIVERRLCQ